MKKNILLLIISATLTLAALQAGLEKDSPSRGEYVFPLEKIWEVDSAGDQVLGTPSNIWVAEDGRIFCYDRKNLKYYIFDPSGNLIKAFGKRGEGPGEIRRIQQAPLYLFNNTLIILDTGKLHYFDRQGKYLKSIPYTFSGRPNLFLNEDECLVSPRTIFDIPRGKGTIRKINLITGEKTIIKEFDIYEGGAISEQNVQASMVVPTLTPLMVLTKYRNNIYYGMSDRYRVDMCDFKGRDFGYFGLERKKNQVDDKIKIETILRMAKGLAPEELLRKLAMKLPDDETYFFQIIENNGLIYLFNSHFDRRNIQKMDIFSPEGKYLYRAVVRLDEDIRIQSGPVFKNGYLYLSAENDEGDILLCKYKTSCPR